jgi:hypothetical protein
MSSPTSTPASTTEGSPAGAIPTSTIPGDGGGAPPSPWHENLISKNAAGEETLADPSTWLDRAPKPLGDFVRAQMTSARAKVDGLVRVPGADAKPEEVTAFRKATGVPDVPEGYNLAKPEQLPEGVTWDENRAGAFAKVAHEIGLSPAQVAKLNEWEIGNMAGAHAERLVKETKFREWESGEMKRRFGDGADAAVLAAQRVALGEGLPATIFDPTSGDFWGVEALALAAAIARKLGEEKLPARGTVNSGLSPGALAKDIVTNADNPQHKAFHDPKHPQCEATRALVADLYRRDAEGR